MNDIKRWDRKSWLWVFLCSSAIFATVPLARTIQKFVYNLFGKIFFTYAVLAVILVAFGVLFYHFFFRFRVKKVSQYLWLFSCAALYIYFTIALRKYPEEAVHLLQYTLLSFFVFRALSYRVRDWTVYATTIFIVLLAGMSDEFIQWMMPGRYWGFNDVWINLLASMIFAVAVSKGIRPVDICEPSNRFSLKILAGIVTVNLLFFGLCLSNTPDTVKRYTAVFGGLSWLLNEEPMTEFGYKHTDPEAGMFMSRMTLEELWEIDLKSSAVKVKSLKWGVAFDNGSPRLENNYSPHTAPFLFEFIIHVNRRANELGDAEEVEDADKRAKLFNKAYRENMVLEKYFPVTLEHYGLGWPEEKSVYVKSEAESWGKEYTSEVGLLITFIDLKTIWALILGILALVWVPQLFRKKTV